MPTRIRRDPFRFAALFDSKPLFRRSLHTKSKADLFARAAVIHAEFERLIAKADALVPERAVAAEPGSRIVTATDLEQIASRYTRLIAGQFDRLHALANVNEAAADELDRLVYDLELDAEEIRRELQSRRDDDCKHILHPSSEARHVVADQGFVAPEGSPELGAIIAAVRNGMEQGFKRIGELAAGRTLPALPEAKQSPPNSLTLAQAVDRYLEARKPRSKAVSETRLALRRFEEVVGRKALAATSRDDFHRFAEHLANQKVGGKTPGSVVRHLSEHSIRKRLRMLGAAINHAKERGWISGDNPAAGIKVSTFLKPADKAVMPDKRRLQVSEMNAIFAHPWFTGCRSASDTHTPGDYRIIGSEYWVPVVAAYTGCRAAELGGLKVSEVRLDHPFPHIVIRNNEYRPTKSKRSRCVPILDALMELGFADYVTRIAEEGHERLFPDWTAQRRGKGDADYPAWSNARIIRAFNRTVIPATLKHLPEDARREVTFHSLRGAFKAMLGTTNAIAPNIVHEVIGHSKSELDERYIGEVTIEETYPAVHKCNYIGLTIFSAAN